MRRLDGRTAVVTGGASGIGLALAQRFARAGMRIVLADVEGAALEAAAARLEAAGADTLPVLCDVSRQEEVDALADAAERRFGPVQLVCNNAGSDPEGSPLWELPREDVEWVLGVNLWGVVHGIRTFVPRLVAAGEGHVVNTASVAGFVHPAGMGPYNATKAAVVALSETLHLELRAAGTGVGVSVLCPGWVRTNIVTSDRNRPAHLDAPLRPDQEAALEARRAFVREVFASGGIEPAEVADLVHDAVVADRFYVFTHPAMMASIEARFGRILAGDDPEVPQL